MKSSDKSGSEKGTSSRRSEQGRQASVIVVDEAVQLYLRQLDDHRKLCELSGKYSEAGAAARRIQELKAAQAHRILTELAELHYKQLAVLQDTYQQETAAFDADWRSKVTAYEAGVAAQLTALKAAHEAQMADVLLQCEVNRPVKPHHSAEYLNNRKVEERLVKQGEYRKAHELKAAADAMYYTELASTQAAWDSQTNMKTTKLQEKHQSELEVLLQRAARGRNELELKRLDEAEKRGNRFRCEVQDLEASHRQRMVHLQQSLG